VVCKLSCSSIANNVVTSGTEHSQCQKHLSCSSNLWPVLNDPLSKLVVVRLGTAYDIYVPVIYSTLWLVA